MPVHDKYWYSADEEKMAGGNVKEEDTLHGSSGVEKGLLQSLAEFLGEE